MDQIKMTARKRAGKIYDVFLGEMHLFTSSKLVADPICNSFNEHGILKAKAVLFDKLCIELLAIKKTVPSPGSVSWNNCVNEVHTAVLSKLSKAKDLP